MAQSKPIEIANVTYIMHCIVSELKKIVYGYISNNQYTHSLITGLLCWNI